MHQERREGREEEEGREVGKVRRREGGGREGGREGEGGAFLQHI